MPRFNGSGVGRAWRNVNARRAGKFWRGQWGWTGSTQGFVGEAVQGRYGSLSAQTCRQATDQRYRCGERATQALRARIDTAAVTCTIAGRDRYTRVLGICYAADWTDLNGWLVRQGYALAYRRYSPTYIPEED